MAVAAGAGPAAAGRWPPPAGAAPGRTGRWRADAARVAAEPVLAAVAVVAADGSAARNVGRVRGVNRAQSPAHRAAVRGEETNLRRAGHDHVHARRQPLDALVVAEHGDAGSQLLVAALQRGDALQRASGVRASRSVSTCMATMPVSSSARIGIQERPRTTRSSSR